MKKIISLLLVTAMTFALFNFTLVQAHTAALNEEEKVLLELVGVINEEKKLDDNLTRGEFADMLAKIAFELNADVSKYNNGKKVSDVMITDSYYNSVNSLYNRGYISVDSFGCFYPEREITTEEATDMAVGILGYSKLFSKKLFNKTTQSIASEKGLYKGITATDGKLSLYNAYKLIYNILTCDVSELRLFGENDDELMFMSSRLYIYEIQGVVTDDGLSSLYGTSKIDENQIAIDGVVLENGTEYADLLGYNVKGYYEYSRIEDEATLLAIGQRNSRNDVTVLLSGDIEEFKDRTYIYCEDEVAAKTKKIKIPKEAIIIYNGKSLTPEDEFENSKFVPEHGRVKLHDNNKDGEVDIVKIEDYKTAIVNFVDSDEDKIYLKNNIPAIDMEEKKVMLEDKDGKKSKSAVLGLNENDVISYIESMDGEYLKILVASHTEEEKVSSIEKENGKIVSATINLGVLYKLTPHAQENYTPLEIGSTYKFYFDAFDMVAGYEKTKVSADWEWGSLVNIWLDDETGGDFSVAKIYTDEEEFLNLKVAEKVKVIHEDDKVVRYDSVALANVIDYTGIIRYKINSEEEITCIELPHAYGSKPTVDDRLFVLIDTVTTGKSNSYYTKKISNYVVYGGKAVIDENTKVFEVPADAKAVEDYSMSSATTLENGLYYEMYLYGTDYRSRNAAVACLTSGAVNATGAIGETPITVKDVEFVYDEKKGEAKYKLTCLNSRGGEIVYDMDEEMYENEVFSYAAGDKDPVTQKQSPVKIQPGDMLYYSAKNGEFQAAVLLYDSDVILKDEKGNDVKGGLAGGQITYYSTSNLFGSPFGGNNYKPAQPGNASALNYHSAAARIWVGWVYSVENGFFQITNQNPAYGYDFGATEAEGFLTEIYPTQGTYFVTTEINGKKVNVRKGDASDLKPYTIYGADCSRVVITQRVYDYRSFNIIND